MPEHLAPRKRNPGDEPVRIVYHAGERTFARLFNESSLEEVKNVVRRKLGLNRSAIITLKQLKSGKLLDLEDDDDFEAFRVLLSSPPSADIEVEVTVGGSQSTVVPPVAAQPQERPPERASFSPEPVGSAMSKPTDGQPPHPVEASTAKTPKRKRKVSFGDVAVEESPKSVEKPSQKKQKIRAAKTKTVGPSATSTTPVALSSTVEPLRTEVPKSAEGSSQKKPKARAAKTVGPSPAPAASTSIVEPPRAEEQVSSAEPPKEKRKAKKAKEVKPAPVIEFPAKKASDAPQPSESVVPSTTESEKETETSAAVGTSKPTAKKQSKQKKGDIAKKPSAPVDQDGVDSPVNDPSNAVGDGSLQPALKKPRKATGEGEASKSRKSEGTKRPPKPSVCASILSTSESRMVQDEITAAILSGIQSNASGIVQPEHSVPQKAKKKESKKPPLPPTAQAVESESVPDASTIKATANGPTETALAPTNTSSRPLTSTSESTDPCPICLQHPFHLRYSCPTVKKGPDAIRQRLEEVRNTDTGDQQSVIDVLEGLLKGASDAPSAEDAELEESSPLPPVSAPRTPLIPRNSYLSEVTVESKDEGSSSDSSEDTSAGEDKVSPIVQRRRTPDEEPPVAQDDLEAVIRGPVARRQSVLDLIDQVANDEDAKSDSEEEKGDLEEDQDEEIHRSKRQLAKKGAASSDSETEEEESRSLSPQPSEAMEDDDPSPAVEVQNKHVEIPVGAEEGDVVMKDSVADVPVRGKQFDDSGEETQVEPEEAMVVDDDSIGVKAVGADKAASPVPISDAPPSKIPASQPVETQAAPQATVGTDTTPVPLDDATAIPDVPAQADVDPIEPAEDLEPPSADPIDIGSPAPEAESLFSNLPHSTPRTGMTTRLRTRNGRIPDSDERPVTLEQFASELQDEITPLPANGRTRRKSTVISASQEPVTTRKSARFSSLPPPTTPAAVVLLSRRKSKTTKIVKTPAKETEAGSYPSQSSATGDPRVAPTPSTIGWEAIAEPVSSPQIDEALMQVDELSSSPPAIGSTIFGRPNGKAKRGRPRTTAPPAQSQSSQEKERLFDLTPSQVPFPYSQYRDPAPVASFNRQENEVSTDSEEEKTLKKKPKLPARKSTTYRSLSQLASQATLFSPGLPTPANTSGSNGKAKKNVADDSSSSDSDSDSDETNGSGHIPQNRKAGSVLAKKKRSLLARA